MILNERIKELRQRREYTLKEVAARLGVSEATVQRYESGAIQNIPYDTVEDYAAMLGCSPAYLMGWESKLTPTVSDDEMRVVLAYRDLPENRREVIRLILGIDKK